MAFILIVVILLGIKLAWDWKAKNQEKRIINHARSAMVDGGIYVLSSWILFLPDAYLIAGAVILALGFRWIAFDILFNLLNKDKWDHCGDSSFLDRWSDYLDGDSLNNRCNLYLLIKAVPIIIGIVLCLI